MLKTIMSITNAKPLGKKKQAEILGGMQYLCDDVCTLGYRRCYITKTEYFYEPC